MKLFFIAALCLFFAVFCAPSAPVFAEKYQLDALLNFFDFNLAVPVFVDFDHEEEKYSYSFYTGLHHTIYDLKKQEVNHVVPGGSVQVCLHRQTNAAPSYLPNYPWKYVADRSYRGQLCHHFTYVQETETSYTLVELFTKHGTETPVAVQYGRFVVLINDYTPDVVNGSAFIVPSLCSEDVHTDMPSDGWKEQALNTPIPSRVVEENAAFVRQVNAKANRPDSMKLSMNEFSHLTWEEFKEQMGLHPWDTSKLPQAPVVASRDVRNLPPQVDWSQKGHVTRVKNQAQCGSCWAFGVIATLETAYSISHKGKKVEMSEQNIMDCAWGNYSNHGCFGGMPPRAFNYILEQQHGLLVHSENYPYKMANDFCQYDGRAGVVSDFKMKAWGQVPEGDYHAFEQVVATRGSVVVGIAATNYFRLYSGGLLEDPECDGESMNHAVTVVGYGTTETGIPYWKVKNSWGDSWGVNGYFFVRRGVNKCHIEDLPTYPIV